MDRFGDGSSSVVVRLEDPGCTTVLNLTLPASCQVLGATMKVSSVVSYQGGPQNPTDVSVRVGDLAIWEFDTAGFGPLGRQDRLAGDGTEWDTAFGPGGGMNTTALRLPAGAEVRSATIEVSGTGPNLPVQRFGLKGNYPYGYFGSPVTGAGDVNGDGYDDVIGGAPVAGMNVGNMETGYAALFFGGPNMGASMDRYFHGPVQWGHLGVSVSGAGDLNRDGYDDIIIGADEYVTNDIGHAYVFFGGANMDVVADVTAGGEAKFDTFGCSVSGAGDVNGDGYDDVIVGARLHISSFGYYAGRAHILFGGPQMDNLTDVVLDGSNSSDFFGCSVSGAGDLNGDGYDDVVVGASGAVGVPNEAGYAKVFLGGKDMDNVPDLTIKGKGPGDALGMAVSGAGDLNRDGYDDLLVGALQNDAAGEDAGAVYVFFGGKALDGNCDLVLTGLSPYDKFGKSVAAAGDLDNDGYDDIMVGAPENQSKGSATGSAYAFFGGPKMDAVPEAIYASPGKDEYFGASVAGAGDVDRDGWNESVIGMPRNSTVGPTVGTAGVYGWEDGLPGPSVLIGGGPVWAIDGRLDGSAVSGDFSDGLNAFLWTRQATGNDAWGNSYIDVPVAALASGEGSLTLKNISIAYDYTADVADFSVELNDYLAAHRAERDASGNLTVPVNVLSRTPGKVKLFALRIDTDDAPCPVVRIPDLAIYEDTAASDLLCLRDYFSDDSTAREDLVFGLSVLTNSSIVRVALINGTNISADAADGPQNDNWTGTVELLVTASDHRGSTTDSSPFFLEVRNVPDPPVITSEPPPGGLGGKPYSYRMTADDGDRDPLDYGLRQGPAGMTVDAASGLVRWTPSRMGRFDVSLAVSDGLFTAFQNFSIDVPNSPPRVANSTVPSAYTDSPYSHTMDAVDDNGDALAFSLLAGPEGLRLDNSSGRIDWTPARVGQFPVQIAISDGITTVTHGFALQVLQGNRAPVFRSAPVTEAFSGVPYAYLLAASDPDGDAVSFSAVEIPPGMTLNASTGNLTWTPAAPGTFPVRLRASDGRGGTALQEFSLRVAERVGPTVEFISPAEGRKVSGKFTATGNARNGTLGIVKVQFCIDDGPWTDASGLGSWQFTVDTTRLKDGKHTLQARAFDGMDYCSAVNRTVLVANGDKMAAARDGYWPVLVLAAALAAGTAILLWRRKGA